MLKFGYSLSTLKCLYSTEPPNYAPNPPDYYLSNDSISHCYPRPMELCITDTTILALQPIHQLLQSAPGLIIRRPVIDANPDLVGP